MALTSISIISSSSSFPSNSTTDPPSTSTPTRTTPFLRRRSLIRFPKGPFSFSSLHTSLPPQNATTFTASSSSEEEDSSPEQFLQNNSIADFMRFKRGVDGGSGELQTALVSYKKRFPWFLLRPFLQVDLVSTIHIADEEYGFTFLPLTYLYFGFGSPHKQLMLENIGEKLENSQTEFY